MRASGSGAGALAAPRGLHTRLGHEKAEAKRAGLPPAGLLSALSSFPCPLPRPRVIAMDFISLDFSLLWPRGRVGGHGKGWHFLWVAVSAREGHSSCWANMSCSYSFSLSRRPRVQTAPRCGWLRCPAPLGWLLLGPRLSVRSPQLSLKRAAPASRGDRDLDVRLPPAPRSRATASGVSQM